MDKFNPDSYLASFDPDAYLKTNEPQQTREQIMDESRLRKAKIIKDFREAHPIREAINDYGQGALNFSKSALNEIAGIEFQDDPFVDKKSKSFLAGQILDPVTMVIGMGVGKLAQVGKLISNPLVQSTIGGALGGGVIGGLSEDGDATSGALMGGAFGAATPLLSKEIGKGIDLFKGGISDNRAKGILKAIGLDSPEAIAALEKAKPGLNVAQIINDPTQPKVAALQRYAQEFRGTEAWNLMQAQEAARKAAMSKVAGGATSEASQTAQIKASENINKMLEPMRNRTFLLADESGKLKTDPIINGIDDILSRSDVMKGGLKDDLLTQLKGMLGKNTDESGLIKAEALHSFRKEEINNEIQKLLKNPNDSVKKQAAKVAAEVRDLIDDSINNASGGKVWSSYLNQYSKLKQSVNKMKMGNELRSGSDDLLVKTSSGENPEFVTQILGRPGAGETAGFAGQMGKQAAPFQQAGKEVIRDKMLSDQIPLGMPDVKQAVSNFTFAHKIPNMLNAKITATNMALKGVDKLLNAKTIEKLSKAMYSPQETLRIINSLPFSERNIVLKAMQDPINASVVAGMMTGATQ